MPVELDDTEAAAVVERDRVLRGKERRGYRSIPSSVGG